MLVRGVSRRSASTAGRRAFARRRLETQNRDNGGSHSSGRVYLAGRSDSLADLPGEDFAFVYEVTNRADADATDVMVDSDFPVGLTALSTSASCTVPGATSECDLFDPIPPRTSQAVLLVAEAPAVGNFVVNGTTSRLQADPDVSDNADSSSVAIASTGKPAAALTIADFDATSKTFDIGAVMLDTPRGVLGTANGSFDGAVNFMVFDGAIDLRVVEILGLGEVAFGFVERNTWTPSDGDGSDLFGRQFNASADRVFAVVDEYGFVSLYTADAFDPGRLIGEATVSLDPNKSFSLLLDLIGSNAQLLYDGAVVLEGDPFTADTRDADLADLADLGDDQVISIGFGTEFRGVATITQVPEAAAPLVMLAGAGMLRALASRRRRRGASR